MKHKPQFLFAFCIAVILTLTSINTAYPWGEVKKAKDFMSAGMYPQAIELLNKRISDKPTDAEAHYQLGICYINTGNYSGADERFGSAVRLDSEYGYKIGGEYKRVGSENLSKGRTSQALALFRKAVQYQPNLKKEVAQECFSAGNSYLNQRQSNIADGLLSMAQAYDPSLSEEIKKVEVNYGKKLLELAQKQPKKERKQYIDEARKYLDQRTIEEVFPPPSWKTVFDKEFVGVGHTGGDEPKDNDGTIHIAELGKDILIGDKTIIKTYGNNGDIWDGGKWQKYRHPIINRTGTSDYFCARAKKGVKFKVTIKRFISNY